MSDAIPRHWCWVASIVGQVRVRIAAGGNQVELCFGPVALQAAHLAYSRLQPAGQVLINHLSQGPLGCEGSVGLNNPGLLHQPIQRMQADGTVATGFGLDTLWSQETDVKDGNLKGKDQAWHPPGMLAIFSMHGLQPVHTDRA